MVVNLSWNARRPIQQCVEFIQTGELLPKKEMSKQTKNGFETLIHSSKGELRAMGLEKHFQHTTTRYYIWTQNIFEMLSNLESKPTQRPGDTCEATFEDSNYRLIV